MSGTQLTATAPAGTANVTVDVTVTTAGGTSSTSPADQYTYSVGPTVTDVVPNSGTPGTEVTVYGSNFEDTSGDSLVSQVTFGGVPAAGFGVTGQNTLIATAPQGSGTVDVQVTTPGGQSALNPPNDQFTYTGGPAVTSMSPPGGRLTGGNQITITGTNLSGASAVNFGTGNPGSNIAVAGGGTQLTVATPAAPGGVAASVNVTVTTPQGTSPASSGSLFAYTAVPILSSLSPPRGPTTGGTTVIISGAGLSTTNRVRFGTAAEGTIVDVNPDGTTVTAVSPPLPAGQVGVTVGTLGGESTPTNGSQFRYLGPTPPAALVSPGPAMATTPPPRQRPW